MMDHVKPQGPTARVTPTKSFAASRAAEVLQVPIIFEVVTARVPASEIALVLKTTGNATLTCVAVMRVPIQQEFPRRGKYARTMS